MAEKLTGTAIQSGTITTTQLSSSVNETISAGGGPKIKSLVYPGDDTAANTAGGQTVYILGSGFASNSTVLINGNAVPSLSFISSSNLSITTPALSAATYPVYVINPEDGAMAILYPGIDISGEPTWSTDATLPEQGADDAWSISLSATSDSSVTYALADGSSLPTGISLAANGLISGTLSSPPNDDTTYNFSVIASDAENQDATRAFSVNITTGEGVLFANNVLLIHADGTNNQNNNVFLDSSNNNSTITRNGNATQGSFSPFSQTGWSNYFDGDGDYLSIPDNAAFGFGTGDWTLEAWLFVTKTGSYNAIFDTRVGAGTETGSFGIGIFSTGRVQLFSGGAFYYPTETITFNAWQHLAVVKSSGVTTMYFNGVAASTTYADSRDYGASQPVQIGKDDTTSNYFGGHISNFRIIKGTALYTSNFTPSTTPLQPIANTSLLTCQSNAIVDEGPNNFAITRNGDVSVQPYSPFAPVLTSANSHSVYFDGNGDYLASSNQISNFGTSDFTMECWVYKTGASPISVLSNQDGGSDVNYFALNAMNSSNTNVEFQMRDNSSQVFAYGPSMANNAWTHIAVTRSNNSVKVFVNGVSGNAVTISKSVTSRQFIIGAFLFTGFEAYFGGYISNVRVVKGTAVYTENFTPSTSPLTNIANTSLLTCQSSTVVDNSDNNFTITASGNAVPKKFNPFGFTYTPAKYSTANVGGSGYFDGSGDYLTFSPITLSGAFTAEAWVYHTGSNNPQILQTLNAGSGAGFQFLRILNGYQYVEGFSDNPADKITGNVLVNKNSWNHLVITRNNTGTIRIFTNGILAGSATPASVRSVNVARISGVISNGNNVDMYTGYISDLRVMSNTTLYTSNFTPPSAPLTNIANTSLLCNFTNAGIFDSTAKNVLETVGDAKVSTAQYKYGTGSIYFDGSGDYLEVKENKQLFNFGTGDFTIEMWYYANASGGALIGKGPSDSDDEMFVLLYSGIYYIDWGPTSGAYIQGGSYALSQWNHFALVRNGTSLVAYHNGTSAVSTTLTANYNFTGNHTLKIGAGRGGSFNFNGYIDDFRISRFARYTSNFTPPTSALKDR